MGVILKYVLFIQFCNDFQICIRFNKKYSQVRLNSKPTNNDPKEQTPYDATANKAYKHLTMNDSENEVVVTETLIPNKFLHTFSY